MEIEFVCPICKNQIVHKRKDLFCHQCSQSYKIDQNVPYFNENKAYNIDSLSSADIKKLKELTKENGWNEALHLWLLSVNPTVAKLVSDTSRVKWTELLNLDSHSRILDLGCGFGTLSVLLSKIYKEVVSLDGIPDRVQFLQIRKEKERLDNIYPVCNGNSTCLPFKDNYFDLVILNGVMEYFPLSLPDMHIDDAQKVILKEINRIIKPDGYLYIATKNRYGYHYILGTEDHNGLKFTSLLPRFLADLVSRIMKKGPYRMITYSYNGYQKLLSATRFYDLKFHWPVPGYQFIEAIVPMDKENEIPHYIGKIKSFSSFQKTILLFFNKIGLLKHLIPFYSIVAKKRAN